MVTSGRGGAGIRESIRLRDSFDSELMVRDGSRPGMMRVKVRPRDAPRKIAAYAFGGESDLSPVDLRKKLTSLAEARFVYLMGVADLDVVLGAWPDALEFIPGEFSRAVVFGIRLQDAVVESIVDRPTPLYFHNYRQANYQLDRLALEAAALLQREGHSALAIAASQNITRDPPSAVLGALSPSKGMRGHVSHRLLGWAAGLGWWGRNNLLVNPDFGARVRYVSVLTDAPLEPDEPLERDCGKCVACLNVCPAAAVKSKREAFDREACYKKLCEFARIPFVGQHICGVCVKACHPSNWPG